MHKGRQKIQTGFTIVELLIVIVVIAILAAISVAAYTGVQDRSRNSKIESDLTQLEKAIMLARINEGEQALRFVTLSAHTAGGCTAEASGADLAALNKTTHNCWVWYSRALQRISDAAGMDVTGLTDPWGRPYYIDENEKEGASQCGIGRDLLAAFAHPYAGSARTNVRYLSFVTPGC